MITLSAAQNYTQHLTLLLARKAGVQLTEDEFTAVSALVLNLLETEARGDTKVSLDELELNPSMLAVLGTAPLKVVSGNLYTERTHAALEGVRQWFDSNSTFQTNNGSDLSGAALKFVPPELGAHTLRLGELDQVPAVLKAATFPFCVITGGPGTGKTTLVATCIAELFLRHPELEPESIVLCAPTGKAAHRLKEGVDLFTAMHLGDALPDLKAKMEKIPEAKTLHRLLGASEQRPLPLRGRMSELPYKIVILDESSMVGAELMCSLLKSLGPNVRVILAGDADQLPSVECGTVFKELVDELENRKSPNIQRLTVSRRSVQDILTEAKKALHSGLAGAYDWKPLERGEQLGAVPVRFINSMSESTRNSAFPEQLQTFLVSIFKKFVSHRFAIDDPHEPYPFKIISPTREGRSGVVEINRRMHELAGLHRNKRTKGFMIGEPVMVTQNLYHLGLFNGDTGIVIPAPSNANVAIPLHNSLHVEFRRTKETFSVPLEALTGRVELAWASTCHKVQGSEYQHVFIVLPSSETNASTLVSNSWLYTAITRAKETVTLFRLQPT